MSKREAEFSTTISKRTCARGYTCKICKIEFELLKDFDLHKHVHEKTNQILNSFRELKCLMCDETFLHHLDLQRHIHLSHSTTEVERYQESIQFGAGESRIEISRDIDSLGVISKYYADMSPFECDNVVSEFHFFQSVQASTFETLHSDLDKWKNLKVIFRMHCHFIKENVEGKVSDETTGKFTSFSHLIFEKHDIARAWTLTRHKFSTEIEEFICERSGWILDKITLFGFTTIKYQISNVGTYIATPFPLSKHKTILLNIDNSAIKSDERHNKCFLWSILAHDSLAGVKGQNRTRINKDVNTYISHVEKLNVDGIKFPITFDQLPKFEELNPNISLTILGYDMDNDTHGEESEEFVPPRSNHHYSKKEMKADFDAMQSRISILYNSKKIRNIHVDLLCLMNENRNHFILIKSLEGLMRSPNSHHVTRICRNCLQTFRSINSLHEHAKLCLTVNHQRVKFPKGDEARLNFRKWERTQPVPFRFYADFEAFLPEYDFDNPEEMQRRRMKAEFFERKPTHKSPSTQRTNIHKACGYSWICVDFKGQRRHGEFHHAIDDTDDEIAYKFVKSIADYCQVLTAELDAYEMEASSVLDQVATEELVAEFRRENKCCFCKQIFLDGETTVRHHMHIPPYNFVGLAHNKCNLQAEISRKFPIFLHNFGSYDVHFIMQALGKLKKDDVIIDHHCISKTSEKMLSVTLKLADVTTDEGNIQPGGSLQFVDSLGFTLKSLDALVKTMKKDPSSQFNITRNEFAKEAIMGANIDLLFSKGAYPYSLMTSVNNFALTSLPTKEEFYNTLTNEAIKDDVYDHAQQVWSSFKITNMGEWHDLYVRLDAALLADVMETVRCIMFKSYELDLAHYLSLPMMSIDCALKKSGITLELITDPTIHLWIEKAIRGGLVSVGSQRAAKANNPYMDCEYDVDLPTSYLLFIDANNLYGKAMTYPLPTERFMWLCEEEVEMIAKSLNCLFENMERDSETGYILEVDLEIDPDLHDKFNDYPPAPLQRTIAPSELSTTYQLPIIQDLCLKDGIYKTEKLIADLHNKKNYILYCETLKEYVKMGIKVSKVHRILSFRQSPWMKDYIDFNTEMRKKATSDFEKDFWKLLNNSAFGKTIEQVRKRLNVRIVSTREQALRFNKKPTVQNIVILNETTCLFMMKKLSVTLNKPIFTGVTILEIAKKIMFEMHYEGIQKMYGNRATLLYTDTDSLIYRIETKDIYQDMFDNRDLFDMSDYPKDHPIFGRFHDGTNKKVLGKFKDEYAGKVITHVVCPRPKMYTIKSADIVVSNGVYQKDFGNNWLTAETCSKKVKGIAKASINNQIQFEDFVKVMEENIQTEATMTGFRSIEHRIFTEVSVKKALNGLDTKRFAVDNVSTLAFGHKDIPLYNN